MKSFKQFADKILKNKKSAQKFLIELGTHDKTGNLTKKYQTNI